MKDTKYIVFKREDFYNMMGQLALPPWKDENGKLIGGDIDCAVVAAAIEKEAETACIQDATVIRAQDIFAAPALHSYANSIAVALEVLKSIKEVGNTHLLVDLVDIADYFHQRAMEAEQTDYRKLPD